MRVALHSDNFARRARFGLSRYSHEIHGGLAAHGIDTVPISAVSDFGDDQPDWLTKSGFRRLPLSRRVLASMWASGSPVPRLERWLDDVDIIHSLDVDYPIATAKPWIITYHDLGVLVHPEYFGKARPWLLRSSIAAAARRAAAIICVSRSTADEVMAFGGAAAADRIHVIEEGVGEEFFAPPSSETLEELPPILSERPFFLFTGSLSPRKNFARVIAGFANVAGRLPHRLVLTGARGWDTTEDIKAITATGIADRIVELGYVSDAVLRALYARATAFLYPSLYEGFGLPILEAMASGCPVVTSNMAPMTEVGGDAAVYVDPRRSDDVAVALMKFATDSAFCDSLRERGRLQARRLNWETCVHRTIEVYHQVAQEKRRAPR
jgi:glycosyltransferase involved in cell wall biosynthesis